MTSQEEIRELDRKIKEEKERCQRELEAKRREIEAQATEVVFQVYSSHVFVQWCMYACACAGTCCGRSTSSALAVAAYTMFLSRSTLAGCREA